MQLVQLFPERRVSLYKPPAGGGELKSLRTDEPESSDLAARPSETEGPIRGPFPFPAARSPAKRFVDQGSRKEKGYHGSGNSDRGAKAKFLAGKTASSQPPVDDLE